MKKWRMDSESSAASEESDDSGSESDSGTESDSGADSDDESGIVIPKRSRPNSSTLPFESKSIEKLILQICENFDFRVVVNDKRVKRGLLVTTGLTIAGGILGKHYGGKLGAAVGGAIGGACGVGIVAVSMKSLWDEIKDNLGELFDIVYDYLAGLGLDDYKKAATFLTKQGRQDQLAMLVLHTASGILGKKILSSLTPS